MPPTATPAATSTPEEGGKEAISFTNDVFPILQQNCIKCHSDDSILGAPPNGLRLDSYENVLKGSAFGPQVLPGQPKNSLIVIMVQSQTMPADGPPFLSEEQIQKIVDWIAAGAPNN